MSESTTVAPTVPTEFAFGGHTFVIAELPPASLAALVRRGLGHVMGNEVASKVTAHKAKNEGIDDEALAAFGASARDAMAQAIKSGTLGAGRTPSGEPAKTPLETIMNRLILADISLKLAGIKLKLPSGDKVVTMPNGETYTRAQLVARQMSTRGDHWKAEAEKEAAKQAKAVAKQRAAVEAGGVESLGL